MAKYRKKTGSDTWHWCTNCTNYPTSDYTVINSRDRPSNGELCNQCLSKENNSNCSN